MRIFIITLAAIFSFSTSCQDHGAFEVSPSTETGWKVYQNEYIRFELPARYKIAQLMEGTDSVDVLSGGEIHTEQRQYPEFGAWFSDETSTILFQYSMDADGPEPGDTFSDGTTYTFTFSKDGKYLRRRYINSRFDSGQRTGGIFIRDTLNGLNYALLCVPQFDEGLKFYDITKSSVTKEELERLSSLIQLLK